MMNVSVKLEFKLVMQKQQKQLMQSNRAKSTVWVFLNIVLYDEENSLEMVGRDFPSYHPRANLLITTKLLKCVSLSKLVNTTAIVN